MPGLFSYPKRKLRRMVRDGDYKGAVEFGRGLEATHSGDADYLFIMGSIHYMLGDGPGALHYLDRSLEAGGPDADTLFLKAGAHAAGGDRAEARRCCEDALRADPGHRDAREMLGGLG